jgi:hypothetical protein
MRRLATSLLAMLRRRAVRLSRCEAMAFATLAYQPSNSGLHHFMCNCSAAFPGIGHCGIMKFWVRASGIAVLFCCAHVATPSARILASNLSYQFNPVAGGHGCVNAATDTRIDPYGIICSLQQRYSYKSNQET